MFSDWKKFKGWLVLEYFLHNPSASIHVRGLARKLGISPLTSNTYLHAYSKIGLLSKNRKGNASFYSLVVSPLSNSLKKTLALSDLWRACFVEKVLNENPQATSIILYGSMASGEFDEKSDYDLLVFSKNKAFPTRAVNALGREVNLKILTLEEWLRLSNDFRYSIQRNHVVLYGSGLVFK